MPGFAWFAECRARRLAEGEGRAGSMDQGATRRLEPINHRPELHVLSKPGRGASRMWRRRRIFLVTAVCLLLVCTAVFLDSGPSAKAAAGETEAAQTTPGATEQVPSTPQAARVKELVNLRTVESKTYELADGQQEWVGYTEPVHYKDASGVFQDIDNSIVSESKQVDGIDYAYRNAANAYSVRFAAKGNALGLVSIESEGRSVTFGPVGVQSPGVAKTAPQASKVLSEETWGESLIQYADALPGIDLVYQPRSAGIAEYIVLKEPGTQNEITFNLILKGLSVKQADGQVAFVDGDGKTVFVLGQPAAFDDAEAWTNDVSYQIKDAGSTCQVTVTLSPKYLDDPARVYPVVIDPEIIEPTPTADTYISQANGGTNYSSSVYLRTGRDATYTIRRSFLKFDQVNDLTISGDQVTEAYLQIEKIPSGGGVSPTINAWWSLDPFTCTSMTWNSGTPHWDGSANDRYGDPMSSTAINISGNWWRTYVTTPVQYWLDGLHPNYGWMIKQYTTPPNLETGTSTWTTFYSSNQGSPHRPELHIVYILGYATYGGHKLTGGVGNYGNSRQYYWIGASAANYEVNIDTAMSEWTTAPDDWNITTPIAYTQTSNRDISLMEIIKSAVHLPNVAAQTDFFDGPANINGQQYFQNWDWNRISLNDDFNVNGNKTGIIAHEMGHCFGLDHVAFSGAIMRDDIAGVAQPTRAQPCDLAGINYLY